MKVLLKEEIGKLGSRGDVVQVADGFARNYLLPRHLAVTATPSNFRQIEIEKAKIAKQAEQELAELEAACKRLQGASCTIAAAAAPEGHLYGSVGSREIAEALKTAGFDVTESSVKLEQPFKEIGVFLVELALAPNLAAKVPVWIVSNQ